MDSCGKKEKGKTTAGKGDEIHQLGIEAYRKGDIHKAERLIREAIRNAPQTPSFYNDLGVILKDQNRLNAALSCFQKAVALNAMSPMMCCNLAEAFHRLKDVDNAEKQYCRAIHLKPDFLKARFNLAILYHEQRRFERAISQYKAIIAMNPGFADSYYYLASAYHDSGQLNQAIDSYEKALGVNPGSGDTYNNMGSAWLGLKKIEKAIACFNKALTLDPTSDAVYVNLGNAYQEGGQHQEALHLYRKALKISPSNEIAFLNMGISLANLQKERKARSCFKRAHQLNPQYPKACAYLVNRLYRACEWKDLGVLDEQLDRFTGKALDSGNIPDETPFQNICRHADPMLNMRVAAAWSNGLTRSKSSRSFIRPAKKINNTKIRIGYLSNTFSNHPGAQLIAGVFRLHDHSAFQIYSFSYGINDGSHYRKHIEKESDFFFDIGQTNDAEAAALIRKHKIDVLVDLRGFTYAGRIGISALRPASIHVHYLGYPGTTGANFIDYMIVDKVVVPEAHIACFSEKLVYMPHCYQANDNAQKISDRRFKRSDFNIPGDVFAYCSFSTHYKIEPVMFDCWSRILQSVPNSVLCLLEGNKATQQNLKKELIGRGIDENRLIFIKKMPKDEHLARLRLFDLALDTRIYNGHTTTSDALWAGLPVVTLQGDHFASRVSASILQAMDVPELITENIHDYEALAVKIGMNCELSRSMKEKIKEKRATSSLFDTNKFTKNLEQAYRAMVKIHENGEKPRLIEVQDRYL